MFAEVWIEGESSSNNVCVDPADTFQVGEQKKERKAAEVVVKVKMCV